MKFNQLSRAAAAQLIEQFDAMSDEEFESQKAQWALHQVGDIPNDYLEVRDASVKAFDASNGDDYAIDLNVGFALYRCLSPMKQDLHFTNVVANDDDFWRYLTCIILPDITYARYPQPRKGDIRIAKKRFYLHTRRIWPKTLWWYIHLSWQGSEEATREVLRDLGTDTIGQLIERTGKGYRLPLYRELMRAYAQVPTKSAELFKRIQAQNTVNCKTVEPALTVDGEEGYIRSVFVQQNC